MLARWTGWGAVPQLYDATTAVHGLFHGELAALLSPEELRSASRSTLNAHYTTPRLAASIWSAVQTLGFAGGTVLEPGCGVGTFIGLAPEGVDAVGVELDPTTAAIAAALYPEADVRVESFADTRMPEGYADLVIGNVPFGSVTLADSRHNARGHSIHNHFLIKALRLTRPGGLVAAITSRYTLDAVNPSARRELAELADLVYAVRLPEQAHHHAGTQVVTDLLVLRRRPEGWEPAGAAWERVVDVAVDADQAVRINEYFAAHSRQIVGQLGVGRGQYRDDELTVCVADADGDPVDVAADRIRTSAAVAAELGLGQLPPSVAPTESAAGRRPIALVPRDARRPDGYLLRHDDGTFGRVLDGAVQAHAVPRTQVRELGLLLALRDTYVELVESEAADLAEDASLDTLRDRLNRDYDSYTTTYGPINRFSWRPGRTNPVTGETTQIRVPPRQGGFRDDPFAGAVYALEHFDAQTQSATKASIFTTRVVVPRVRPLGADTPADALAICLDSYGEVRVTEVARLLGVDEAEARARLGQLVFEDPGTPERLIPAAAYLSDNVRRKLTAAQAAAHTDARFEANVTALRAVIPPDISPDDIAVRLGGWVGRAHVQLFLREIFANQYVTVEHAGGGQWAVRGGGYGVLETDMWGTP